MNGTDVRADDGGGDEDGDAEDDDDDDTGNANDADDACDANDVDDACDATDAAPPRVESVVEGVSDAAVAAARSARSAPSSPLADTGAPTASTDLINRLRMINVPRMRALVPLELLHVEGVADGVAKSALWETEIGRDPGENAAGGDIDGDSDGDVADCKVQPALELGAWLCGDAVGGST